MKIAVRLARNWRLLAWCALSLLLHLLALIRIDAWTKGPVKPIVTSPLAVRLEGAAPSRRPASRPTEEAPVAPTEPVRPLAPDEAAAPLPPPRAANPTKSSAQDEETPAEPEASQAAESDEVAGAPSLPGTYQIQYPPSTRLSYAVTRTRPGTPEEALAPAQLVWKRENYRYELSIDGVLGELESEGRENDAGIAPHVARERALTGGQYTTRFNHDEGRIDYPTGSVVLPQGSQDRASVLMQLAAIGLAQPNQMESTVEIVVGSASGARIARFEMVGKEELETGAGRLATVHLAQRAKAGERRVEIWLAPQRHWMPVQLRVTEPDGSVATQVVTRIETEEASEVQR